MINIVSLPGRKLKCACSYSGFSIQNQWISSASVINQNECRKRIPARRNPSMSLVLNVFSSVNQRFIRVTWNKLFCMYAIHRGGGAFRNMWGAYLPLSHAHTPS